MVNLKKSRPKSKADKVRTTFKISESLHNDYSQAVIADGYNMREKSIWVEGALENLLKNGDFMPASLMQVYSVNTKTEQLIISSKLLAKLDVAVAKFNVKHLANKVNRSDVIRMAISRRMMGLNQKMKK